MSSPNLPLSSLPVWATFNNIAFSSVKVDSIEGKGQGLIAETDLSSPEGASEPRVLLKVPHDAILCNDVISGYAKVDKRFSELLEAVGPQPTRMKALIFLLTQRIHSELMLANSGVSTPWTAYVRYLPEDVFVPTMWHDHERALLRGTSLESAVEAKLTDLTREFDTFQEKSAELLVWGDLWEKRTLSLRDWILADAWYRSRSLELPRSGDAMVPIIDMANHSPQPSASYEENVNYEVTLQLRPGATLAAGEEVTITYGENKSAAEILFSYGFIDVEGAKRQLVLPLTPFEDDPLIQAKLHSFKKPPMVDIRMEDGEATWKSAFAFYMCLNEEDGLEFRVLQDLEGGRQLKVFWQDEDVTDRVDSFDLLIDSHEMSQIFRLRVVTVIEELVGSHMERMESVTSPAEEELLRSIHGEPRSDCLAMANTLRDIEYGILEAALGRLREQKAQLLADESVAAYLGSMEDTRNEQVPSETTNEEADFS
ncbi:hypothetical protein jhhlp_006421 [Lomentospora prolificans]|uniref:SET domain-containing protein n=1 Tax=Lomentospora prolificans TaxID=41688 RepID=A0A2N3N5T3_9PEZI|nr:hypothetical protein jhhlp_006421 [Lomentospora prolificans]